MSDQQPSFPSLPKPLELEQWADALRRLAEKFTEEAKLQDNPKVLRRTVNGTFAIQAGKLLCNCYDRNVFVSSLYGWGTAWDLRCFLPDWLREKAERARAQTTKYLFLRSGIT